MVKVGLKEGLPRLVESQMVGFTRIAASSPALDSTDIATFTRLAQSHGPLAAKELHIDRHGFGADGALKLAPLLASAATLLPNLEKLDLSYNALSDAGLRAICSALADGKASDDREASSGVEAAKLLGSEASHKASCLRLRCLDLTHNSIGDEGFDSLLRAFRDGSMRVGELLIRDGNSASEAAHSRLISGWKRAKELHRKSQSRGIASRTSLKAKECCLWKPATHQWAMEATTTRESRKGKVRIRAMTASVMMMTVHRALPLCDQQWTFRTPCHA